MSSLIESLSWRYATKKMNGQQVPQDKLDYILEATRLSPSSSGLQPYRVILVSDPELKHKIKPIAFQQGQIIDSSHLMIFAAWDGYSPERIGDVFDSTLKFRGLPMNTMDDYKKRIWGMYEPLGKEWHAQHAAKQSYIALGFAMAAAAEQKVDATPMEGFNPVELDELLGLQKLGLKSVTILALGYRDSANDWLAAMPKYRTPLDELVIKM